MSKNLNFFLVDAFIDDVASFNEGLQDDRKLKIKKFHNFLEFKTVMEKIEKRQLAAREREEQSIQLAK